MHAAERLSIAIRHSKYLSRLDWLWHRLRPLYNRAINLAGRGGLERVMNGTDRILIAPRFRNLPEAYEKEVWQRLMDDLRPGGIFVDVGVYIGLYAVAAAQRVGAGGRVYGFEPDPRNYSHALEHVKLNALQDRVELIHAAVGERAGRVLFKFAAESGHIATAMDAGATEVDCVTLDQFFSGKKLDVLKIDVEGYEEKVLRGAAELLQDDARCPRAIYVEVHPYAWGEVGTTSESLLALLRQSGYHVKHPDGRPVDVIDRYGEVIARRK